jgi:hypothetical protein
MNDTVHHPAERMPIIGSVMLTAGDNFAFLFARLSRLLLIASLTALAVAAGIWILGASQQELDYYRSNPTTGLKQFAADMMPVILGYVGLFIGIAVFSSWLAFRRMPSDNRNLTFHADAEALKTTDTTGAALTLPWALVRQTRVTKRLLLMQLRTRAWRFLPLRAFSAEDQRRLIAIAVRSAAKP